MKFFARFASKLRSKSRFARLELPAQGYQSSGGSMPRVPFLETRQFAVPPAAAAT